MYTKRQKIVEAIATVIRTIDGTGDFLESIEPDNVRSKLLFWDEVEDYPTVAVVSGTETRDYKSAGLTWGELEINITIFVENSDPKSQIERLFVDIENVLNANNTLTIDGNSVCTDLRILSFSDDNGVLAPLGIGEIFLTVKYNV